MEELLRLIKHYTKDEHLKTFNFVDKEILSKINTIYNDDWDNDHSLFPYDVITYILDCYYILPERPDLASLFAWQAINNLYRSFILKDVNESNFNDGKGLSKIVAIIEGNPLYYSIIENYATNIPNKVYRFVSSYLLKTYSVAQQPNTSKFWFASYNSLINKITTLKDILNDSYGYKYKEQDTPSILNDKIIHSINQDLSRKLTHSFSLKLKELFINQSVTITGIDGQLHSYSLTNHEKIIFLINGILYASRCNNFHGNVPSRLNSINADEETYKMYLDIFLLEYMIVAICLHYDGRISDEGLNKVVDNYKLMM